jgi:hypothetical protein
MKTDSFLFLRRAHWLDLAVALSDRSLTMAECARQLGLANSVIRRPLRDMAGAGLLETDDDSLSHGTRYRLRSDLVERVEEEIRQGQPQGVLIEGQVVLMVEAGLLDLANALVSSDLSRNVIWVAELGPAGRYLVVLDGRSTSPTAHGRLIAAIEGAGGTCGAGGASRVMSADAWRRLLATYRDAAA